MTAIEDSAESEKMLNFSLLSANELDEDD